MNFKKTKFTSDIVQSPEWLKFSKGFDIYRQKNIIDDWFILYEAKYLPHGYDPLQFLEEHLQIHHS